MKIKIEINRVLERNLHTAIIRTEDGEALFRFSVSEEQIMRAEELGMLDNTQNEDEQNVLKGCYEKIRCDED